MGYYDPQVFLNSDLNRRPSRLDLIDSSQLTSFPLAHPVQGCYGFDCSSPRYLSASTLRDAGAETLRGKSDEELASRKGNYDYSSPLVLIEDYIEESQLGGGASPLKSRKRISVVDFKNALKRDSRGTLGTNGTNSTLSTFPSLHRSFDSSCSSDATGTSNDSAALQEPCVRDAVESQSPTKPLKYCVICERPLYEISSLIPVDKDYQEIVCSDCFHQYEAVYASLKRMREEDDDDYSLFDDTQSVKTMTLVMTNNSSGDDEFASLIARLKQIRSKDDKLRSRIRRRSLLVPLRSDHSAKSSFLIKVIDRIKALRGV